MQAKTNLSVRVKRWIVDRFEVLVDDLLSEFSTARALELPASVFDSHDNTYVANVLREEARGELQEAGDELLVEAVNRTSRVAYLAKRLSELDEEQICECACSGNLSEAPAKMSSIYCLAFARWVLSRYMVRLLSRPFIDVTVVEMADASVVELVHLSHVLPSHQQDSGTVCI